MCFVSAVDRVRRICFDALTLRCECTVFSRRFSRSDRLVYSIVTLSSSRATLSLGQKNSSFVDSQKMVKQSLIAPNRFVAKKFFKNPDLSFNGCVISLRSTLADLSRRYFIVPHFYGKNPLTRESSRTLPIVDDVHVYLAGLFLFRLVREKSIPFQVSRVNRRWKQRSRLRSFTYFLVRHHELGYQRQKCVCFRARKCHCVQGDSSHEEAREMRT